MCEVSDGLVSVVHGERHSRSLELEYFMYDLLSISSLGYESNLQFACSRHNEVSGLVLIGMSVTSDDNGLSPSVDETRNILDDDGLTEDSSSEDVSDGSIRGLPHLFQFELLYSRLVGGDSGTLDSHIVLESRIGSIDGHLVIGGITMFDSQIEEVNVEIDCQKCSFSVFSGTV